jgi:hypothetical protein
MTTLQKAGTLKQLRQGEELLRGERELWRGRQWIVTTCGFEAWRLIDVGGEPFWQSRYWFEIRRLGEGLEEGGNLHSCWLVHLAKKGWVDLGDFTTAFLVACVYRGVQSNQVIKALNLAHKEHGEDEAYAAWAKAKGLDPFRALSFGELAAEVAEFNRDRRKGTRS